MLPKQRLCCTVQNETNYYIIYCSSFTARDAPYSTAEDRLVCWEHPGTGCRRGIFQRESAFDKKVNSVPEGIAHFNFDPSKLKTFSKVKLKQAPNRLMQCCFLWSNFTRDEEKRKMPKLTVAAEIQCKFSECGSRPGISLL